MAPKAQNMTIQIGAEFIVQNLDSINKTMNALKDNKINLGLEGAEEAIESIVKLLKNPELFKPSMETGQLTQQAKDATAQINSNFDTLFEKMVSKAKKAYSEMNSAQKNSDFLGANKFASELQLILHTIQDFYNETEDFKFVEFQLDTKKTILNLDSLEKEIKEITDTILNTQKYLQGQGEADLFQPAVTHTLKENIKKYNKLKKEITDITGQEGFDFSKVSSDEQKKLQEKAKELARIYGLIQKLFENSEVQSFNRNNNEDGIKFSLSGMKNKGTYQKELQKTLSSVGIGEDIVQTIANEIKNNATIIQEAIAEATKDVKFVDINEKNIKNEDTPKTQDRLPEQNQEEKQEKEKNEENNNVINTEEYKKKLEEVKELLDDVIAIPRNAKNQKASPEQAQKIKEAYEELVQINYEQAQKDVERYIKDSTDKTMKAFDQQRGLSLSTVRSPISKEETDFIKQYQKFNESYGESLEKQNETVENLEEQKRLLQAMLDLRKKISDEEANKYKLDSVDDLKEYLEETENLLKEKQISNNLTQHSDDTSASSNTSMQNLNNLTAKITKIEVAEEAKTQLQTDLSKIATIYISDVKLADGTTLSELRNSIETTLNIEPIRVNVLGNTLLSGETEGQENIQPKLSLEIEGLNISNPEIVASVKKVIEKALSPIVIESVDGTSADVTSLQNKLDEVTKVITIEKIELDGSLTVQNFKNDIINALENIKMPNLDTSTAFNQLRNNLQSTINNIKAPKIKPTSQMNKNEKKNFENLVATVDKVTEAINKKTNAFIEEVTKVKTGSNEEIEAIQGIIDRVNLLKNTLGTLKKIQVVFEKEAEENKKPKDDNKKTGKKKKETITADVNEDVKKESDNQEKITEEVKEASEQKKTEAQIQREKNRLLKEELELVKKIADEKIKTNSDQGKISEWTNELEQNRKDYQALGLKSDDKSRQKFFEEQVNKTIKKLQDEQKDIEKGRKKLGENKTDEISEKAETRISALNNIDSSNINRYADSVGECIVQTEQFIEDNKKLRKEMSDSTGLNAMNAKYENLIYEMRRWANANDLALKSKPALQQYNRILDELGDTANRTSDKYERLKKEFKQFQSEMEKTGKTGGTFATQLSKSFESLGIKTIVNMGINYIEDGLRQMLENVRSIDTAMTQLKKVTNETSRTYNEFLDTAGERAEALGSTMTGFVTSTADFAKLGYNVNEAAALAENAIMYSNVGDLDIETATNDLVSITKAFGFTADETSRIVDSLNEVGNNYAVSAAQLGEGLNNSASSLVVAGNSMDESVAMLTAMTEITQDASSAGAALRTLSLRIRGAKTELSELGESTDDMAVSTAKLRDKIKGMTGVDIMIDDSTFKSTYAIIQEMSKVWDNLSDIDRTATLELLAGKNRSDI